MQMKSVSIGSCIGTVIGFLLLFCLNTILLLLAFGLIALIMVNIQQLDGPTAALLPLYLAFLAAGLFSLPITLLQMARRNKK